MALDNDEHKRLVEIKEDENRDSDIRFLAKCLWKINLHLEKQADYQTEQSEQ